MAKGIVVQQHKFCGYSPCCFIAPPPVNDKRLRSWPFYM